MIKIKTILSFFSDLFLTLFHSYQLLFCFCAIWCLCLWMKLRLSVEKNRKNRNKNETNVSFLHLAKFNHLTFFKNVPATVGQPIKRHCQWPSVCVVSAKIMNSTNSELGRNSQSTKLGANQLGAVKARNFAQNRNFQKTETY